VDSLAEPQPYCPLIPSHGSPFVTGAAEAQRVEMSPPRREAAMEGDAGRVLITDDQQIVRATLRGLLEPLGYTIFEAERGAEALSLLDRVLPDVLLLDLMMPEMDGFEVLRRLRSDPRWLDLPVLLVTSLDDRKSRLRGLELGADDFLTKPVDVQELRARVGTTVRLGRMRRQLQAQQRFTWTVEHSSDGFVWLDQELRVAGCNAAAGRWLGLGDRMLDRADVHLPSLLGERFRIRPRIDWLELSATREAHEITLVRPESRVAAAQWLRLTLSPLPAAPGDDVRWMAHLEDVTALQNTMGQAVSLLGLMNHKLRTPLAMVRTPVELLTQGYMGTDDPDWPKFRDQLDAAISRLQRDVDQLLRMADLMERPLISAGETLQDQAAFERVAHEVAMDLGIDAKSVSLRCEGERVPRMGVEALQLVLMQLFGNALKFHPERTPLISLKLAPWDEHKVRMEIEDDGPGIPEELQEQVWQPMYQIDRIGAGEVPGAGIGLSLVANIAWRLGGRCWIESTVFGEDGGDEPSDSGASAQAVPCQAHGTRVCLLLPAVNGNAPESP